MDTLPALTDNHVLQSFFGMPSVEAARALGEIVAQVPQTDLGTTNVVHGGMCARTVFIPAGTVLVGAVTNMQNISVVFGDITVTTDEGPKRLTGFNVLPANPGFKRAGVTNSDTWWTTVWRTNLTDIEAIEDEMTDESEILQTRRKGIVFAEPEQIGVES